MQECADVMVYVFIINTYHIIRKRLYCDGSATSDEACLGSWLENVLNHVMQDGEGLIFRDLPGCRRGRIRNWSPFPTHGFHIRGIGALPHLETVHSKCNTYIDTTK